jgi:putative protease
MSDIILPAPTPERPEILAPAGDAQCFTAALAAGADAVYLGLKHFSARMQAENFGLTDLSRLTDLAHEEQARVYVAMNVLVKPQETAAAYRLIHRLARQVRPDGIIVQDLAMLDLARQAGFEGEINLSTLANITHPQGLQTAKDLGASRVILPRELSIDEIIYKSGFSNRSTFFRGFVLRFGCTPKVYREQKVSEAMETDAGPGTEAGVEAETT